MKRPTIRALGAALLCSILVAGCGGKGTFVVIDFSSGPTGASSIHLDLVLNGVTVDAIYRPKAGTALTFPTTASLEIGSAAGNLVVKASALDAIGTSLATGMGSALIVRDATTHLDIALSAVGPVDDLGPSGALVMMPKAFDFGAGAVGTSSAPKRFTVTNTGTAQTGQLMVLLTGMDAADYAIAPSPDCLGKSLAAAATCTVDVVFSPATVGLAKTASLHVLAPTTTAGGTASAALAGRAGQKGALSFNEATHTFPNTLVGTAAGDTVFTLTNTGTQPSTAVSIALTGSDAADFQTVTGADLCDGKVLAGGATCTVTLRTKPTHRGLIAATLSADATTGGLTSVSLSGKGMIAAQLVMIGGATAAAPANLGQVDVGSTGAVLHSFTLRNDGDFATGPISLTTSPVAGLNDLTGAGATTCAPMTMMGGGTGTVLNPGDSCLAELALKPQTFGTKTADLTFTASPGGAVTTSVTGVGHDQVTIRVGNASPDGSTGTIGDTAIPSNFNCIGATGMCSKVFDRTTSAIPVTFVATADAATYSLFNAWSMAPTLPCSGGAMSTTCSLNLDASVAAGAYTYTANYTRKQFTVTYNRRDIELSKPVVAGGLGALSSSHGYGCPQGPCATTTEMVPGGSVLTISAAAAAFLGGKTLRRISGPCTAASDDATAASCSFNVTADVTVNSTFSAHNYAFISTSQFANGNLGGRMGANVACQADATVAKLPGTFVAWLSTSDAAGDAINQLGTANGWVRVDGRPFQLSQADISGNNALLYPLNLDASGAVHRSGEIVFTNTGPKGTKLPGTAAGPCGNWTLGVSGGDNVGWGQPDAGSPGWTQYNSSTSGALCASPGRIYCLGKGINYPIDKLAVGTNRVAFLSNGSYTPNAAGGLAAVDALCNGANAGPFSTRTFKALVADSGNTAASRFNAAGAPWVRPDGVLLTDTAAQLLGANPPIQAALDVGPSSTYASGGFFAWTGATAINAPPLAGDTCGDWKNSINSGRAGAIFNYTGSFFNVVSAQACTSSFRLYCLEQ